MKVGIKVGPNKVSLSDIRATHPQVCEVWFDIGRSGEYTGLFDYLNKESCDVGLHFWGALNDGSMVNICYPDTELLKSSMNLIQQTIDIAATRGFQYVNIHPGSAARVRLDMQQERFGLLSDPISFDKAEGVFLEHMGLLHSYALQHGIVLTVETVPPCVSSGFGGAAKRNDAFPIYQLPNQCLVKAAQAGYRIANDFGHTAALIHDDPSYIWTCLKNTTVALAPYTDLIHLGFTVPPYNGTDIHDHLDNPLLETDLAIPNRKQMIELLKLFQKRNNVWMLAEPESDHIKNYFLVKKIVKEAAAI